uniref:Uncharacterized protein n=1 Tax=Mycoplasma suis TaxID=57372 RepID=Q8KM80_9MOLU|nr:hypothetical protein [Mycoplasma suis]
MVGGGGIDTQEDLGEGDFPACCVQGQRIKSPDSSQYKVIGVELGRQDLTHRQQKERKCQLGPDETSEPPQGSF